jgi:hypothetical protein
MRFIPVRRHEIAEILLKLALKTNQSINQSINQSFLSDKDIRNRFKMYIDPVLIKKYFRCALQEHPSSSPVLSGILVARSLALNVHFVDRCLSFCTFSFGQCFVSSS